MRWSTPRQRRRRIQQNLCFHPRCRKALHGRPSTKGMVKSGSFSIPTSSKLVSTTNEPRTAKIAHHATSWRRERVEYTRCNETSLTKIVFAFCSPRCYFALRVFNRPSFCTVGLVVSELSNVRDSFGTAVLCWPGFEASELG
jgi:hypothetical protein